MKEIINSLENIIIEDSANLNQKINGINFLEAIKLIIIDKLDGILEILDKNDKKISNFEFSIKNNNKELNIMFFILEKDLSVFKKEIINDTLLLSINSIIKIDIFSSSNNDISSINLLPKKGICLSSKTKVNINYPHKAKYMEILLNEK